VITGFNTEIEVDGEIYHLQTEDKGKNNPIVETLVYKGGGQIIASRITPYAETLGFNPSRDEIIKLMRKQHKEIMMAIKNKTFQFVRAENITKDILKKAPQDGTLLESIMDYLDKKG